MLRFVTFVDGSNLDGVLKHLNLRVDDYGSFIGTFSSKASTIGAERLPKGLPGRPPSIRVFTGTSSARWMNGT